ncbi:hypothetical protein HOLleu_13468 [Holothuria leucospilota]|uniref:Uncharacterized protein n=1 Tax=Holothuria leucospilota TaxID=206669 RepID=A0A9Q1HDQ8_HOLLE|nr:hypothetical protein HOLleu_13468 [Holothuria leucospilota]
MLKIQGISPDTLGSIKCLNDSLKRLWKMRKEHFGPTSAAPFRSNGVKDDRQQEKPSYQQPPCILVVYAGMMDEEGFAFVGQPLTISQGDAVRHWMLEGM